MAVMTVDIILFITAMSSWDIIAFLANICVIIIVIRNKKMHTVTNYLICNLAFSDIFLGAFVLPQNIHDTSHPADYHEGKVACKLANCLPIWCIFCSVYSLTAISWERLRSIVYHQKAPITIAKVKALIASIWIAGVVVTIPTMVEYRVYVVSTNGTAGHEGEQEILGCGTEGHRRELSILNGVFLLLVSYLIPTIIMTVNYSRLLKFILLNGRTVNTIPHGLKKQVGEVQKKRVMLPTSRTLYKKRMKIVKMLMLAAALFCLCWLPYFTILIMAKISGKDDSTEFDSMLNLLRITLSVFSTSYNAVLYIYYNDQFRKGFAKLFGCSNNDERESSRSHPVFVTPIQSLPTDKTV